MTSRATQEYLGPKRRKNPARWGCTHLYRLYKGVPPGGFIRPRRHMDSQSGRENRRDERFQVTPFHPACLTASLKTFSAPSLPTRLTAPVQGSGFHLATYIQMKIYSSQKLNAYCVMLRFVLRISKESGP